MVVVSERNAATARQGAISALQVHQAPVQTPHAGSYLTLRQPSCGFIMHIREHSQHACTMLDGTETCHGPTKLRAQAITLRAVCPACGEAQQSRPRTRSMSKARRVMIVALILGRAWVSLGFDHRLTAQEFCPFDATAAATSV